MYYFWYRNCKPKILKFLSHAIQAGNLIFVSGKIGFTKEGKLPEGGLTEEVHQVMQNFQCTLEAAGCTFDNGIK